MSGHINITPEQAVKIKAMQAELKKAKHRILDLEGENQHLREQREKADREEREQQLRVVETPRRPPRRVGWVWAIAGFAVLGILLAALLAPRSPQPVRTVGSGGGERIAGQKYAKHLSKHAGVLPSSAKWPWDTIRVTDLGNGDFHVRGTAETKNAAHVWGTTVYLKGDHWQCRTFVFDGVTLMDDD